MLYQVFFFVPALTADAPPPQPPLLLCILSQSFISLHYLIYHLRNMSILETSWTSPMQIMHMVSGVDEGNDLIILFSVLTNAIMHDVCTHMITFLCGSSSSFAVTRHVIRFRDRLLASSHTSRVMCTLLAFQSCLVPIV